MQNLPGMIPFHILIIIKLYLWGILFFSIFRFLILISNSHQWIHLTGGKFLDLLKALLMGWRFDTVVSGYILAIPLIILLVAALFRFQPAWMIRSVIIFSGIMYSISFFMCAADIPYFKHFFNRLNISILLWTDTPNFMMKQVVQEKTFIVYFALWVLVSLLFWYRIRKILKKTVSSRSRQPISRHLARWALWSLMMISLTFVGIRGRLMAKSPIRTGTAYFSKYPFFNQLGLNPAFTFIRSYLDAKNPKNQYISLMDTGTAQKNVRKYFHGNRETTFLSPVTRPVQPAIKQNRSNIIIIIMESMCAGHMKAFGNQDQLTPNLDYLAQKGLLFTRIYSDGPHTFNGLYATLFSYPSILEKHPMKVTPIPVHSGISNILRKKGYQTIYFSTHDDQFDNVGGFFRANGFQRIISQKSYPKKHVKSLLGVPDHYMFEFSLPYLHSMSKKNSPFLAVYLTASNHKPFMIPKKISFTPRNKIKKKKIIEYSDWSIGKFIKLSEKEPWFQNTLFVFVADHGAAIDPRFPIPIQFHHIPLIFFGPDIIGSPRTINHIGGQIDIFPTIMGVLGIPYVNSTFGIDLLREHRPYTFFCNDKKIGCIDDKYFFIWDEAEKPYLYEYTGGDLINHAGTRMDIAVRMKRYVFSMLQTAQYLVQNHLTGMEHHAPPY